MKVAILTDSFVLLHALLLWLRIEVVDISSQITSCEMNFCWVTSASFEKFYRNLCRVLVLAFCTPILCSYAEMDKIFIAQKSYCACHVLNLVMLCKYYFNFIPIRTRLGRELFDCPSYMPVQIHLTVEDRKLVTCSFV